MIASNAGWTKPAEFSNLSALANSNSFHSTLMNLPCRCAGGRGLGVRGDSIFANGSQLTLSIANAMQLM